MTPRRFAATIAYDGAGFLGSQRQASGRTVQQECETALERISGSPVPVDLAGRTDTGVHALGQVGAFTLSTTLDLPTLERALNAETGPDVAISRLAVVEAEFDPRRWACSRYYQYTIDRAEPPDPFGRGTAWACSAPLDLDAMNHAACASTGSRDFRAASAALPQGKSSVREILRAGWAQSGDLLRFDVVGNAFLPRMVRILVGAMLRVGRGRTTIEEYQETLNSGAPGSLGPAAPARGLCLVRVSYERGYLP